MGYSANFCSMCGSKLTAEAKFCRICGQKIEPIIIQPQQQAFTPPIPVIYETELDVVENVMLTGSLAFGKYDIIVTDKRMAAIPIPDVDVPTDYMWGIVGYYASKSLQNERNEQKDKQDMERKSLSISEMIQKYKGSYELPYYDITSIRLKEHKVRDSTIDIKTRYTKKDVSP